jgi:hypothetical protein
MAKIQQGIDPDAKPKRQKDELQQGGRFTDATRSRMRFPHFRIRTLMIAVAVVAVLAAGFVRCKQRQDRFAELASRYDRESELLPGIWSGPGEAYEGPLGLPYRRGEYLDQMSLKYRSAASHPWLPVPPDPPPPE